MNSMSDLNNDDRHRSERGSQDDPEEPRFLIVGRVGKPHGVRGELRITMHTDEPERFTWLEEIYVGLDEPRAVAVESVRYHKSWALIKFAGYDGRDEAAKLRGEWLQVRAEDAIPLEEGEFFLFDLIGLAVRTVEGELLGKVKEIIETPANNVFVVRGTQGERLVPDIDDVVQAIDLDSGEITVTLLPGM